MSSLLQLAKLGKSFAASQFGPLPLWVHMWITDQCDLACDYCEIVESKPSPSKEDVKSWIVHADTLGSAVIAFMGGEPTQRKDLAELISYASERNLLTYVTTHGQKNSLSKERLDEFGKAGLSVLEISLDGYDSVHGSRKSLRGDEGLIDRLEATRIEFGMKFKTHQVLDPRFLEETPKLVSLAQRRKVPMTFGLVTDFEAFQSGPRTVYEDPEVKERIKETLRFLQRKKLEGAPIMNPISYFEDGLRFVDEPIRWPCDVGTYMIQVATNGQIFRCSKYLKTMTGINFLTIDREYFTQDRHGSQELLKLCNDKCFSACAYTTADYRQKPWQLLKFVIPR